MSFLRCGERDSHRRP